MVMLPTDSWSFFCQFDDNVNRLDFFSKTLQMATKLLLYIICNEFIGIVATFGWVRVAVRRVQQKTVEVRRECRYAERAFHIEDFLS